jgi:hypothetical protein
MPTLVAENVGGGDERSPFPGAQAAPLSQDVRNPVLGPPLACVGSVSCYRRRALSPPSPRWMMALTSPLLFLFAFGRSGEVLCSGAS